VLISKQDGSLVEFFIEKDYHTDLGVTFQETIFGGLRRCANQCLFCFVDQLPDGLRPSLYVKDDDYRLSFLHGSFITLTSLQEQEMQRIITQHLSPLYVSVHSTNPEVRPRLLGNPTAGRVMEQLTDLVEGDQNAGLIGSRQEKVLATKDPNATPLPPAKSGSPQSNNKTANLQRSVNDHPELALPSDCGFATHHTSAPSLRPSQTTQRYQTRRFVAPRAAGRDPRDKRLPGNGQKPEEKPLASADPPHSRQ
jgi:hypothetical protein